ncbi:MAG TPA: efflux transporter outer membrane subunit [Acidobacteriaceae bacterium]|nr:efflux transporter outer membrane subunit [Acidobacteriaceae bacterium]
MRGCNLLMGRWRYPRPGRSSGPLLLALPAVALLLSGCTVGPNYHPPAAPSAPAFKEDTVPMPPPNPPNGGWKQATPNDSAIRGKWWELYEDPQLNQLEEKVAISNQTLKASYEAYMQARSAVQFYRSQYFPTLSLDSTGNRQALSAHRPLHFTGEKSTYNDLILQGQVLWEPDLWGNIRRQVESQRATAQATAADLANVELSVRSELAADYFELRGLDTQQQLLDNTVQQYQQYLELTEARFKGGVATESDVALAQTQLDQTRAQDIDVGVARAQFEHAVATLVGEPASIFGLPPAPLNLKLPEVPVGIPSQLLERRPDIAAAERRADAANAQIGIAISAYYPTISLGGVGGFESSRPGNWIQGPSSLWSLGASAAELIFDAGRRHAITEEARHAYEQNAANYRQTVLGSFQEVEDNLASLRILNSESVAQQRAVSSARRSLEISTNRYKGGVTTYLEVLTAQATQLANERVAADITTRQFAASVQLIKALGGGWDRTQLPSP